LLLAVGLCGMLAPIRRVGLGRMWQSLDCPSRFDQRDDLTAKLRTQARQQRVGAQRADRDGMVEEGGRERYRSSMRCLRKRHHHTQRIRQAPWSIAAGLPRLVRAAGAAERPRYLFA